MSKNGGLGNGMGNSVGRHWCGVLARMTVWGGVGVGKSHIVSVIKEQTTVCNGVGGCRRGDSVVGVAIAMLAAVAKTIDVGPFPAALAASAWASYVFFSGCSPRKCRRAVIRQK